MKLIATETGTLPFSKLFKEYLNSEKPVLDFFEFDPFDEAQIRECAGSVKGTSHRNALTDVLTTFNADFELHPAASANLERLRDPESLTLVTGQQLTIFGGPLYTVFKILTVLKLSSHYESILNRPVIPVFWLADEDHDFEEAAAVSLPAGNELLTTLLEKSGPEQGSVGRITFGPDILRMREQLRNALRETEFSEQLWEILDSCYTPENTFRKATALYLGKLFSRHGLIFAGSDHPEIKKLMIPPLSKAISGADHLQSVLEQASAEIDSVYHKQAQVLDSTLFYHKPDGKRERFVRQNGAWRLDGGQDFANSDLLEMLEDNPEKFSPNVFLRPLLQDHLLPNLGYVGGPGEIAYYGQMKEFYRAFEQKLPLIIPRLTATIIEPGIERIMSDIPLELHDYQQRIEDLEKEWLRISDAPDAAPLFKAWGDEIVRLNEKYAGEIEAIEPTLTNTASKTANEYIKSLDKLKQKVVRAIKSKQETQLKRLSRIKNELFPAGGLQERQIAHIYFMNKYGVDIWDSLLAELTPDHNRTHQRIYL